MVAVVAGCDRGAAPSPSPPSSASARRAPAPSAQLAAPVAPASSAPVSLDARLAPLVGRWRGSSSVYGSVVDDRQTYTRREVELSVDPRGGFWLNLAREESYRCEATGSLGVVGDRLSMVVETSTCAAARAGDRVRFRVERVGDCVQQWSREEGRFPFEVEQLALRRVGCQVAAR